MHVHPNNTSYAHPGFIVPDICLAMDKIKAVPNPTLTDMLTVDCAEPPPGFSVAAHYAASQATLWGLPKVTLGLHQPGKITTRLILALKSPRRSHYLGQVLGVSGTAFAMNALCHASSDVS